jgi:hypothetical protein
VFTAVFLAAWALLNAAFNLRYPYPEDEPSYWYLLPSIDVCVLLGVFAFLGWRRWRLSAWANLGLALLVTVVRLFRMGDAWVQKNYYRPANLYIDLPLLPDLARFLRRTVPAGKLVSRGLIIAGMIVGSFVLFYGAIVCAERFLARGRRERILFAGVLLVAIIQFRRWPAEEWAPLHIGLFGKSVAPIVLDVIRAVPAAAKVRRTKVVEIEAVTQSLREIPTDLRALRGADVLFFIIESYGSALFTNHYLKGMRCPALGQFEAALEKHGFVAASSFLNSTTYGGGSWWAHTTLANGVSVRDAVEYAVTLRAAPPPTRIVRAFTQAGYRSVLVAPGAMSKWPEGYTGFDHTFDTQELEYQGPSFGWFSMTDEYVVDFVHRREFEKARGPLFVEYLLVSSHAPWQMLPLPVHDWSKLDHGRIYHTSHVVHFPARRDNPEERAAAYAYSICYDFDILSHYITERLTRDAFVIIVGDHQPMGDIDYDDPSWAVPIHFISQRRDLIDRFRAAGYSGGMTPMATGPIAGMETFLPQLLELLSNGPPSAQEKESRL